MGRRRMIILGLTGSIGMGKSAAAAMLREMNIPVHDADEAVHLLMRPGGGAVDPIRAEFPQAYDDGCIDRSKLSALIAVDPTLLPRLEKILHPLVRKQEKAFIAASRKRGEALIALDIPLLFETGSEKLVDQVIVVSAPDDVQKQRVLARKSWTEEKFLAVMARQCPNAAKIALADHVIDTGSGFEVTRAALRDLIDMLKRQPPGSLKPKSLTMKRENRCGKSSLTPRPRGSTRARATGSSKSAALS